jgi:Cu/Ag efflux protein CusF
MESAVHPTQGTNPVIRPYRRSKAREIAMKTVVKSVMKSATTLLAGTAGAAMLVSVAFAQDQATKDQGKDQPKDLTGQVTRVNRLDNTIAVRPIQDGTVGANAAATEQSFKVKDGVSLEDLHAGNRITYSVSDSGGAKVVTKFKVQ